MSTRNRTDLAVHRAAPPKAPKHRGVRAQRKATVRPRSLGDDYKDYFAGEAALKAGGADNTMNQFAA